VFFKNYTYFTLPSKNESIREIKIDDTVVCDPRQICNKFNQHFAGMESNLAKKKFATLMVITVNL